MPWLALATTALSAASGAAQRKAEQEANLANAQSQAATAEYSPWTGLKPAAVSFEAPKSSALDSGIQGGLAGLMYGSANDKEMTNEEKQLAALKKIGYKK